MDYRQLKLTGNLPQVSFLNISSYLSNKLKITNDFIFVEWDRSWNSRKKYQHRLLIYSSLIVCSLLIKYISMLVFWQTFFWKNWCQWKLSRSLLFRFSIQNQYSISVSWIYFCWRQQIWFDMYTKILSRNAEYKWLLELLETFRWGRSTRYSYRLHGFSVTIPRCYKDVCVNSFFSRTARLWNSLPIECFPLTYVLNDFKFRINGHLLTVGSF